MDYSGLLWINQKLGKTESHRPAYSCSGDRKHHKFATNTGKNPWESIQKSSTIKETSKTINKNIRKQLKEHLKNITAEPSQTIKKTTSKTIETTSKGIKKHHKTITKAAKQLQKPSKQLQQSSKTSKRYQNNYQKPKTKTSKTIKKTSKTILKNVFNLKAHTHSKINVYPSHMVQRNHPFLLPTARGDSSIQVVMLHEVTIDLIRGKLNDLLALLKENPSFGRGSLGTHVAVTTTENPLYSQAAWWRKIEIQPIRKDCNHILRRSCPTSIWKV